MSDGHENPGTSVVSIELDSERFPRKVLFTCFGIELLLYVLDYHFNYGRVINLDAFRRIFSSTIETSLPSFFSVGQTLLVALTLWLILRVEVARGTRRGVLVGWLLLAGELPAVDSWAEDRFGRSGFTVVRHFAKSAEELIFEAGAFSIFLFLFLRHLLRLSRDELHLRIRGPSPST